MFEAFDPVVGARVDGGRPVQFTGQDRIKDLIDQGAFTGARNPGHCDETTQGNGDVDVLQVMLPGSFDR